MRGVKTPRADQGHRVTLAAMVNQIHSSPSLLVGTFLRNVFPPRAKLPELPSSRLWSG